MRLGVFGGTFDPPHVGHLIVAQDACAALALERVLFVLAAAPPHKHQQAHASAALRLEMLRSALAGSPRFQACEIELERPGPSFTVDTLRQLRDRFAGAELFLLIGADQAREFLSWRAPEDILQLARVVALSRAGQGAPQAAPLDERLLDLPVTRIDISATEIRQRVALGQPIRYLVPEGVETVIRRESLYLAADHVDALGV